MAQQTFEEIVAAVKQAESRGKRYKDDGKTLTTSPKGALGEMQVMPKTILDPGFGVAPAKDKSPDEIARVGVDYLQAMKQRYGDTEKALIAYNWGPGSTDKWLASGADPKKLPAETRTYVERVKGFLGKDVPRETMAKKEREPLPESLPPMAEATPTKAPAATVMASAGKNLPDIKSMPASYQAAFALAALADAKDDEDDKAYDENKETESEKLMREYKPVNHLASLDLSVTPIMMKDGGDVDAEEKRPDDINYFSNVNRMKDRGTTTDSVMLGARTKAGEGSVMAGLNMANMSRDEKLQTARALMLAYTQQDPEGLGFNANVVKPQGAPAMANLMGSMPLGEGRVSAGVHGNQAYSLGYERPVEGGQFNANLNVPRGTMGSPQLNLQFNKRFADGGEVEQERLTPQQIEQYVGHKTKAQLLLEKFKEQAHPRNYTSIIGLGPNIAYEAYRYATGKDPLRDLQKELQKKIDYEVDTDLEPVGTRSGPISGGLPPIRRTEGSPEEGEDVSKPFIGNPNISRQAGQARRNAAIQKASYRDEVAEAKDTARKGEAYQELERYLQSRNAVPDIKVTGYLPEGTHGMFSSDRTNIGTGNIKISKNLHETYMPSTIAHEMTHAADRQMEQQAMEQGLFGKSNQFTEAYKKMVGTDGRNRTQLLRKRYPEFEEDNRYYRSRPDEVAAHAIGAYSGPVMQDSAPRHVDATAATELRILMDLAQRNVDKGPTGVGKILPFFRKLERYADGGEVDMEGQEIKFSTQPPQTPANAPLPATRSAKELDVYIKALNPGAQISYFPERGDVLGHVSSKAQDILNIQKGLSPQRDEETKLHELEHSLGFRGGDPLGRPKISKVDNNYKAYYMLGDWRPMSQFTQNMVDNREKLEQFFGRPLTNAYFKPETLEVVRKQHGDTSALFDEQLASLSALEQITGKSLTRDPEMKKLFPSVKVMSVYDALTGPRQTRLDPRDLPPSTPQPAYTYRDNAVTQFLHKNLLGDNFYPYNKPVKRADGSPEEGERLTPQQIEQRAAQDVAEREAASNAAFIAQKSGIGRKAGPVSQALQSGQGQIEFLKGMTNVPQNILGAPMDISNMIANVYGSGVEKPFMGSEYIKEGLRAKGLGFTPSTDPTLAGFYGAGDLGSNLVNPAGVTRAGVQAAGKTGEAARMLAQDFQQYNQNLAVPGASYAMKPKGGHYYVWPESSRSTLALNPDGTLVNKVIPEKSQVDAYLDKVAAQVTGGMNRNNVPLSDWVKSKVGRYIRSDFATEQDQMVQAAEQGKKLHFTSPKAFEEGAPIIDPVLEIMRKTEGFPKEGFAKTGQGKLVEDIVDSSVWPATLDNTPSDYIPSSIRGLKDTDPNMRIYEFPDAVFEENLKMTNLVTEMDKMMTEKTIKLWNQDVPVPKEYQLDADTLKGLTPAQASNRVAMKEEWLLKKEPEVAGQALAKDPQLVSHRYDNGSKWISPADLSENDMHRQMVNSIGCRGGWCTDKDSFALDYGSGDNRLHILLDKGFQPRAQLTMSNRQGSLSEFLAVKVAEDPNYNTDLFENLQNARASGNQQAVYDAVDAFTRLPEYLDWSRKNNIKQISEIKGQFNKEDLTNQPYLKEIQDFVKRQGPELQSVENLDGIGMTDISSHIYPNRAFKAISTPGKKGMKDVYEEAIKINGNSAYIEDDPAIINSVIEKAVKNVFTPKPNAARQIQMNFFEPPAEKAYGGMIERQPTDNRRYL